MNEFKMYNFPFAYLDIVFLRKEQTLLKYSTFHFPEIGNAFDTLLYLKLAENALGRHTQKKSVF